MQPIGSGVFVSMCPSSRQRHSIPIAADEQASRMQNSSVLSHVPTLLTPATSAAESPTQFFTRTARVDASAGRAFA